MSDSRTAHLIDETVDFTNIMKVHLCARLVDRNRAIVDVSSMGLSMHDRLGLLKLTETPEEELGTSTITDWLSPEFFQTNFWSMWQTTCAFQPWHSAVEFRRYLHRFIKEFSRLKERGGQLENDGTVTNLAFDTEFQKDCAEQLETVMVLQPSDVEKIVSIAEPGQVIFHTVSMTDATTIGFIMRPPEEHTKVDSDGRRLWRKTAERRPEFGNPTPFNSSIPESDWHSFTVKISGSVFFELGEVIAGNVAGTGVLVIFKDSNGIASRMSYITNIFMLRDKTDRLRTVPEILRILPLSVKVGLAAVIIAFRESTRLS